MNWVIILFEWMMLKVIEFISLSKAWHNGWTDYQSHEQFLRAHFYLKIGCNFIGVIYTYSISSSIPNIAFGSDYNTAEKLPTVNILNPPMIWSNFDRTIVVSMTDGFELCLKSIFAEIDLWLVRLNWFVDLLNYGCFIHHFSMDWNVR